MFNIQVDRKANKTTLTKGQHITPFVKLTEWNIPGLSRWPAIRSQGTLTLGVQPLNGETFTIGSKTYTFLNVLTNTDGAIQIGANLLQTQQNIISAINLTGVPGSQYANITSLNQDVTASAGTVTNTIIFTAKTPGVSANSIVLSKTMISGSNIFDGPSLGTTRAGADESDAESIILPHYYGAFNTVYTAGSYGLTSQFNPREMYYIGASEYTNNDRPLGNNMDIIRDFPENRAYMPAGSMRKLYMPNHFERRVKTLKTIALYTKKRTNEPVALNSPFAASTSNAVFKTIELDSSRFIVFYRQQAGTTGIYAVVGNAAADGTITWGTPLLMQTRDMYNSSFDACLINTDKLLIAIEQGASNYINTAVLTISGTGITLNTPVQVAAVSSAYKRLVKIGTDKAVLAYDNSNVSLVCVSVSGTVPSYGTVATIASAQKGVLAPNGTDKAQIAYIGTGNNWYTAVVTASGTSLTVQTGIQLSYDGNAGYGWKQVELLQLTTDKFIFYSDWAQVGYRGRDRYKFGLITVSSTISTLTKAYYTYNTDGSWWGYTGQIMMRAIDANNFYVWFGAYSYDNSRGVRGAKITIGTGNNINFPRCLLCGVGNPEVDGGKMLYTRQEFDSIGQLGDVVYANSNWIFIGTDNNNAGNLCTFSDAVFSFDLYNGDDKVGTFTKDLPFLFQSIAVNLNIMKEEFGIKYKSNDVYDRTVFIEHMQAIID